METENQIVKSKLGGEPKPSSNKKKQFKTKLKGKIKKTGMYKGKSNVLGHGGRAKQLKDRGVPGYVIGELARRANAAPGQKNYHGSRKA